MVRREWANLQPPSAGPRRLGNQFCQFHVFLFPIPNMLFLLFGAGHKAGWIVKIIYSGDSTVPGKGSLPCDGKI